MCTGQRKEKRPIKMMTRATLQYRNLPARTRTVTFKLCAPQRRTTKNGFTYHSPNLGTSLRSLANKVYSCSNLDGLSIISDNSNCLCLELVQLIPSNLSLFPRYMMQFLSNHLLAETTSSCKHFIQFSKSNICNDLS